MKRGVWIYFDLGINGDYEGMYSWLDNQGAHCCGEQLAFVRYEFDENLFEELKAELTNAIELATNNYIYIVFSDEAGNTKGKFLFGKRIRAPWIGYGTSDDREEDVDE